MSVTVAELHKRAQAILTAPPTLPLRFYRTSTDKHGNTIRLLDERY